MNKPFSWKILLTIAFTCYLLKYFIVLSNGNHAMLKPDGTYEIMKDEIINKL